MGINIEASGLQKNLQLIIHLSLNNIKVRYARSVLGPIWLVLTTAIGVAGLGYVWSALFNLDKATFIPSLGIGLVIWQFVAACITEAPDVYTQHAGFIKNINNPVLLYPFYTVTKNLFVFFHNFIIVVGLLIIFPPNIDWRTLWVIPGVLLVIGNLVWMVSILAILGARFRDLSPAIMSLMTIVFFLSPVIFKPDQLGIKSYLIWINPFSYMISLIRDPLLGIDIPIFVYHISVLSLLSGCVLLMYMMNRVGHRVAYWV